jgi:Trk K+ transport system NAD-binding subunit
MHAIIAGPDNGLAAQLRERDAEVTIIDGLADRPALEEAGIVDADLFVLNDTSQATAIPIARDLNDDLRAVVYSRDSVPEFVRGRQLLVVDPDLLGPETVAEELTGEG